ncbi:RNA-directed DNA polymerase [[Clostridium] spiroforme]|nr:RNA-directed DNA polymerase [Thomasclavelia spiroformis]
MKRYCINFKYTPDFIEKSMMECLKTKWKRKDVSYFLAEYGQKLGFYDINFDKHIVARSIQKKILAEGKDGFEKMIKEISKVFYNEIVNRSVCFKPIVYQERYDLCSKKTRIIGISSIKQQIFDYIAVNSAKSMFMSKIYTYQCASIKGRGQLYGVRAICRWVRKKGNSAKYAFKCDVKKYYPSVCQKTLRDMLKRDLKNDDILYVMYTLLDTYITGGLCIGSYLSQFLANYYLSYACHYIMEEMYVIRRTKKCKAGKRVNLVSHTLFYMDDIIMFSSNKKNLRKASVLLEKFLHDNLELELKGKKEFFKTESRPIDMMGYVIYKDHIEIRRHIFLKMRKLLIKYKDQSKKMSVKDARTILSYKGYIDNSDSEKFKKKYKAVRTLNKARKVVSDYDCRIHRKTA